jgi:hypothetical protein
VTEEDKQAVWKEFNKWMKSIPREKWKEISNVAIMTHMLAAMDTVIAEGGGE